VKTISQRTAIIRLLGRLSHDRGVKQAPTGGGQVHLEYDTPLHGVARQDGTTNDPVSNGGSAHADSHRGLGCWASTAADIVRNNATTARAAFLILLVTVSGIALAKVSGTGATAIAWPLLALTGAGHLRRPPKG
jgi:hypothetical protein